MPVLVPAAVLDAMFELLLAVEVPLMLAAPWLVAPGAMNMAAPVATSLPSGGAGTATLPFWAAAVEVPLAAAGAHEPVEAPATAPIVPALLVFVPVFTAAAPPVLVPLLMVLPVLPLPLIVLLEPVPELLLVLALLVLALLELTEPETDTPPEPLLVTPLETVTPPEPLAVVATEVTSEPLFADPPALLL